MNLPLPLPPSADDVRPPREARNWRLRGRVQGVGFRPFVYRLAARHELDGWVRNLAAEVEIFAQGEAGQLDCFGRELISEAPPLARPEIVAMRAVAAASQRGFTIRASSASPTAQISLPPDLFVCDDCLRELDDPGDRRFRYPFINCTQCGPRYTLIRALPYDRANTTMASFPLCGCCAEEYENPLDRRFHAEPIACPDCGPRLEFKPVSGQACFGEAAFAASIRSLQRGEIVAVKGIGGYHLICDATDSSAVARLRQRKKRPYKPLAVLFSDSDDLAMLRGAASPTSAHIAMLRDPMRPIVLVPKRSDTMLASEIAPGCEEIGALLPYSPLHYLLVEDFGRPLVATSGNPNGEPVLTDNAEAEARLAGIADAFLHHDRPIARPADDSVFRFIAGAPRPLRLGRGLAPIELELPFTLAVPTLALGAHRKNTLALGFGTRALISPHLADMDRPGGQSLLRRLADDLQKLYGITAERVLCDAHPGYATNRLARRWGLPFREIYHHRAHASALAAEAGLDEDMLVFTWDGTGFGEDGTIWGGEGFFGRPGRWQRVASLRRFPLLGGEKVALEPWRCALALALETGRDHDSARDGMELLRHAFERRINSPPTSSAGRLFDAAAAFTGLCTKASFDGEAPMRLEAACEGKCESIPLPLSRGLEGEWIADWAPLVPMLDNSELSPSRRATFFHHSMARMLIDQARAIRDERGCSHIGLAGGVFQNRVLTEAILDLASADGFSVHLAEKLPCNDAAISFGQIVEAGIMP